MIKKELKDNLKGFAIIVSILVVLFFIVYIIYPYIINDEAKESMNELMAIFPESVLKAFNMDIASIDTAYGWVKSEGFTFVLLGVGFYAAILGSNILFKEEKDKTIEYLGFLPIKRRDVLTNKLIVSLIYLVSLVVVFTLFNYIALLISGSFDQKEFFLLFFSILLVVLPLFFINLFISTLLSRNKKVLGISLIMVFVFYLFNTISEMSDKVKFFKYFSLYTLADTRGIISNGKINIWCIIISLALSLMFGVLSYITYDKKELI